MWDLRGKEWVATTVVISQGLVLDLGEQDLQLAGRAGHRVGTARSSWNLPSPSVWHGLKAVQMIMAGVHPHLLNLTQVGWL